MRQEVEPVLNGLAWFDKCFGTAQCDEKENLMFKNQSTKFAHQTNRSQGL